MFTFMLIAMACGLLLGASFLAFDDIDVGDALDFTDDGGSGWFSLRALLLFGLGFGAAGALMRNSGADIITSSLIAVLFGMVLYLVGVGIARLLIKQESSSQRNLANLEGKLGVVNAPMNDGDTIPGMARFVDEFGAVNIPIIHKDRKALRMGQTVKAINYLGYLMVVELEHEGKSGSGEG